MKDESIPLEKRINLLYSFILYELYWADTETIPISIPRINVFIFMKL